MANAVRLLVGLLLLFSQPVIAQNMGGGGINNGSTSSTSGSGTITSVCTANGATGGCITTSGTIATQDQHFALVGNAILTANWGGTTDISSASDLSPTIAEAGSAGFPANSFFYVCGQQHSQTLTPGGGTIGGQSTYLLAAGTATAPSCVKLTSDGVSNYKLSFVPSGSSVSSANPSATAGPAAVNGTATTFMTSDSAPAIQKASSSIFGLVEVDNTTITASGGVISAVGGSGNAVFGTVTGNTSGHVVTMSNTTVGVQDSGVAVASLAPLAANNPWTGNETHSGTEQFTGAAPSLVSGTGTFVAGLISAPTFGANGQSGVWASTVNGGILGGQGSSNDVSIFNKGGAAICVAPTNGVTWQCGALSATGTAGFNHTSSANSTITDIFSNVNAGASAAIQLQFKDGNATTIQASITLNGSANSGGNGINSFTIDGVTSLFLQGGNTNAIGINSSALVTLPAITTDAALTDTTVCQDTTAHGLHAGSGTAGICLGSVSSIRFKRDWQNIDNGLEILAVLNPGTYRYKEGVADGGLRVQYGFKAEDYAVALPLLTRYDAEGRPNGVDMMGLVPVLAAAIKEQQSEIEDLKRGVR